MYQFSDESRKAYESMTVPLVLSSDRAEPSESP